MKMTLKFDRKRRNSNENGFVLFLLQDKNITSDLCTISFLIVDKSQVQEQH